MDRPQPTVTMELALRVRSDSIAGERRPERGRARPFVGWIALVRRLEDAMTAVDSKESP